jgi:hypothetical protein
MPRARSRYIVVSAASRVELRDFGFESVNPSRTKRITVDVPCSQ